jgi:hypothetical protein
VELQDPCPCGSGAKLEVCCHTITGRPWKRFRDPVPPPPKTNYSHPKCYLSATADYNRKLSGEHYVSRAVLAEIGTAVDISGMPWQRPDQHQSLPINALTANVLCRRHNLALTGLDKEAVAFFRSSRRRGCIGRDTGAPPAERSGINGAIWPDRRRRAGRYQ